VARGLGSSPAAREDEDPCPRQDPPAAPYCANSATELFSMCSRIPGTIEPVFS
jgi:hypothetical protein